MDDARLAALAADGDERAFEVVYDRHHRALLGFCRHMLGSHEEAEDALQQTFLRAHRALLSRGAPDDVRPWLYTIARNRCLSMLSARKPSGVDPEDFEPAVEGLGAAVERRADLRAMLGDIARLPDDQRAALVLSEVGDLPHAEIAAIIDVPRTKVKALVHQARSRLMADREARETPCPEVREQLASARGAELRRGPLRRHLAICEPCSDYRDAVREQRAALALLLPVVPTVGLKEAILGALGGGGGGGAVAAVTGAGGGGLGAKLAIGVVIAGGAGGGALAVEEAVQPSHSAAPSARAASSRPAPARTAAPAATFVAAAETATPVGTSVAPRRNRTRAGSKRRHTRTAVKREVDTPKPTHQQRRAAHQEAKAERVAEREQRKAAKAKPVKPVKPAKPLKAAKPLKVKATKPVKAKHVKPPKPLKAQKPVAVAEPVPSLPPGQAKKSG
jgi:RNA polymerase sigma factor (sigma-70 family)